MGTVYTLPVYNGAFIEPYDTFEATSEQISFTNYFVANGLTFSFYDSGRLLTATAGIMGQTAGSIAFGIENGVIFGYSPVNFGMCYYTEAGSFGTRYSLFMPDYDGDVYVRQVNGSSYALTSTSIDLYSSYAEAKAAVFTELYPITYRLTNCTAPSAPTEAVVGGTVTVPLTFPAGYGIINPTSDVYVTNNGVTVPSTYSNSVLTFTMPDPS